jgi:nicotinamide phosphoribosyltransferase
MSNLTARSGRDPEDKGIVVFGIQYALKRIFGQIAELTFFNRPEDEVCDEYLEFLDNYVPGHSIGVEHVRDLHRLGYLPLEIRALPEGSFVPYGVPFMTVENTHPDFFWLTNYFETVLSSTLWQPITSATTARKYRKILDEAVESAGVPAEFVEFQAHDFSYRGMPGTEAAAASGAGHLLYFKGSDCLPAVRLLRNYYYGKGQIAGTVPATEHAVMCAGGKEDEADTYRRLLEDLYPTGLCSIVSDTWDLWNVLTVILPLLKNVILQRDGTLVVRPDSGDPVKILVGDEDAPEGTPERKGVVELLWDVFGGVANDKGLRFLDSHVGTIYGDSITEDRAQRIRDGLIAKGFVPMTVLGIGSYTYQYRTRDNHGMAMKATWVMVDEEERLIWKDPITDYVNGVSTKKSAKGRVVVQKFGDDYILHDNLDLETWMGMEPINELKPVWRNGEFVRVDTLDDIRYRALSN